MSDTTWQTETSPIPFVMPELKSPVFAGNTVDIREYGAVGDSHTLNTSAFKQAIEACASAGGGRVVVPPGVWLTGPIHLKSHINLHLERGAEVRFSTRCEDYLPPVFTRYEGMECYNYSPLIYANGASNLAITGRGVLNGQGRAWWHWFALDGPAVQRLHRFAYEGVPVRERVFGSRTDAMRPSFIQPINCRDILLDGITVINGPMWTIHPVYCENLVIRGVTVVTRGKNGDGIDVDSCRNVLIEDCRFETSDDCVAIKSGRDDDGLRVARPTERVVVRRCRSGLGNHCHGVLAIGSEASGGVRDVLIEDCQFDLTKRAVRIKSRRGRGGVIENIWIRNIRAGRVRKDALQVTAMFGGSPAPYDQAPPKLRNIHIQGLSCRGAPNALKIIGLPELPVEAVDIKDVKISSEYGVSCIDTRHVRLSNVQLQVKYGPLFRLENSRDVVISRSGSPGGAPVFVELAGPRADHVRLIKNNLSNVQREIVRRESEPGQSNPSQPDG